MHSLWIIEPKKFPLYNLLSNNESSKKWKFTKERQGTFSDFEPQMRSELALVGKESFNVLQTIETTAANQNASSKQVKKPVKPVIPTMTAVG